MSTYVVATFPSEAKAYEGVRALLELDDDGSITMYDTIVVHRDATGQLELKQPSTAGLGRTGIGAVVGGLLGLFGGPVGAAVGVAAGTLAGGSTAVLLDEVSDEFVDDISGQMSPDTYGVFAEVSEQWTAPIDTRMQGLGGKVLREERATVIGGIVDKRARAHRADVEERQTARQTDKAIVLERRVEEAIHEAQARLQHTAEKARRRLDDTKEELQKKLAKLELQAAQAKPDVRQDIERRIAELRADFAAREQKLEHAFEIAQQALQS